MSENRLSLSSSCQAKPEKVFTEAISENNDPDFFAEYSFVLISC
jgi:hypothetical protein